jgi:hypothetical protein
MNLPEPSKYKDCKLFTPMYISPFEIRFNTSLAKLDVQIPFNQVLEVVLLAGRYGGWLGGSYCAVKKFPKKIQKLLNENSVIYDTEAYEKGGENSLVNNSSWAKMVGVEYYKYKVDYHVLKHKYLTVKFSVRIQNEMSQQFI